MRAFLADNGYRIAQTTLDWEDYLWNSAHARCWLKKDAQGIEWLKESYRTAAVSSYGFNARTHAPCSVATSIT